MTWRPFRVEWEPETVSYLESLGHKVQAGIDAEVDAFTERGEGTWDIVSKSWTRIVGVLFVDGHEVVFYVDRRNKEHVMTIADINPIQVDID